MARFGIFLYRMACYAICFVACVYAVGFVSNLGVPKSIDNGVAAPTAEAFAIDSLLIVVFAVQHSVMARRQFKRRQFIPPAVERHTYFLLSSLALALLFWQWRPIPAPVWRIADPTIAIAATGLSIFGWLIVRLACFINHFELLGLHQMTRDWARDWVCRPAAERPSLFDRLARRPIYLGFMIAFWVAPTMTVGHLLFTILFTTYILLSVVFEQRSPAGVNATIIAAAIEHRH